MIPIVAGLALGALMGGGIAALQKKDILQGALMGGVGGALGGAFMPGIAGGLGGTASGGLTGLGTTTAGAASLFGGAGAGAAGGAGAGAAAGAFNPLAAPGVMDGVTGAISSGGVGGATTTPGLFSGGIGNFLSQNKYALAGGALGGMMAPGKKPEKRSAGNIYEYDYSQELNPNFGNPGERFFSSQKFTPVSVTPVEDYKPSLSNMADGGIVAFADGGAPGIEMQRYARPVRTIDPAVAAYNTQLMELANQQYNINPRPGPNQVPGSLGYVPPPPRVKKEPTEYTDLINTKKDDNINEVPQIDYFNHSAVDGAANGGLMSSYSGGGLSSLGNYSDGGQLLRGPGDGVSDSIPARIGARQPARLADGEFVVPARIVSELGNGSTDAGAKRLYAMMERVQNNRKKTVGKGKVAVDSKARKLLPA
jgi:hypothetical protein